MSIREKDLGAQEDGNGRIIYEGGAAFFDERGNRLNDFLQHLSRIKVGDVLSKITPPKKTIRVVSVGVGKPIIVNVS